MYMYSPHRPSADKKKNPPPRASEKCLAIDRSLSIYISMYIYSYIYIYIYTSIQLDLTVRLQTRRRILPRAPPRSVWRERAVARAGRLQRCRRSLSGLTRGSGSGQDGRGLTRFRVSSESVWDCSELVGLTRRTPLSSSLGF